MRRVVDTDGNFIDLDDPATGLIVITPGAGAFSGVGQGSPAPTCAAGDSLVHGSGSQADSVSNQVMLSGLNQRAYGVYRGLMVGRNNTAGIFGGVYGQFLTEVLCVGRGNSIGTAGTGSYRNATIGRDNTNNGYTDCFTFGRSNVIVSDNYRCATFGRVITLATPGVIGGGHVTAFGGFHTINADNCLLNGRGHYLYGNTAVVTGAYNNVYTGSAVVHGFANTVDSTFTAVFGSSNYVLTPGGHTAANGNVLVVGYGNQAPLTRNALLIGNYNETQGLRVLAFGERARAPRNDQRAWSADRGPVLGTAGAAQISDMARWLETTDDTQTAFITLDLDEDKTYSIMCRVTVRNTTTDGESALFFTRDPVLASRDTAGAAVLVGGPIELTAITVGSGANDWTADLAAVGNNIELQFAGDSVDTLQCVTRFEFDEVLG